MGITISGPSTQIPTNVVEVGNEITQNQLNAITASSVPSTGNPMQTLSALQNYAATQIFPITNQKTNLPTVGWNHPFPAVGNFVVVYSITTASWWPWNSANSLIHSTQTGTTSASYDFSFTDWNGGTISLSGTANVGFEHIDYTTLGYWDNVNVTTYSTSTNSTYYSANGPTYTGNWDNPVGVSSQFYDGSQWLYRYVYLAGSGQFYTADNQNNPPY